jgi:hypothetical protein
MDSVQGRYIIPLFRQNVNLKFFSAGTFYSSKKILKIKEKKTNSSHGYLGGSPCGEIERIEDCLGSVWLLLPCSVIVPSNAADTLHLQVAK